jgi:hypothetical protein
MKKIACIISCFVFISATTTFAQFKRKTAKTTGTQAIATTVALKKEKKAESWWHYAIFDNNVSEENVKIASINYNNEGKVEEWAVFDQKGELAYTYLYGQDPSSNKIQRYIRYKDHKTPVLDYAETYNKLQQLAQRDSYDPKGNIIETKTWEYNAFGQPIRQIDKKLNHQNKLSPAYEISYEYITNINSCLETHINHETKQTHQIAITYNENRQPTEEAHYLPSGELVRKTHYYYDDQNRLSEKRFYPNGKTMEVRETYAYSSLNNDVIHATYTRQGEQLAEYIVYKYEYK